MLEPELLQQKFSTYGRIFQNLWVWSDIFKSFHLRRSWPSLSWLDHGPAPAFLLDYLCYHRYFKEINFSLLNDCNSIWSLQRTNLENGWNQSAGLYCNWAPKLFHRRFNVVRGSVRALAVMIKVSRQHFENCQHFESCRERFSCLHTAKKIQCEKSRENFKTENNW